MSDDPTPGMQDELPKHYLVKMMHEGRAHYVVCEALVTFDESKLFLAGVKAIDQAFMAFHGDKFAEVAPLPAIGDDRWIVDLATMEVGDIDP